MKTGIAKKLNEDKRRLIGDKVQSSVDGFIDLSTTRDTEYLDNGK